MKDEAHSVYLLSTYYIPRMLAMLSTHDPQTNIISDEEN